MFISLAEILVVFKLAVQGLARMLHINQVLDILIYIIRVIFVKNQANYKLFRG
jgi:hypothetical protein